MHRILLAFSLFIFLGAFAFAQTSSTTSGTSVAAISNVRAENIIGSGAQIRWSTDFPTDSRVAYGTSPGTYSYFSNSRCDGSGYGTVHCVNLTNLAQDTMYYYKVESMTEAGFHAWLGGFQFTSAGEGVNNGTSTASSGTSDQTASGSVPVAPTGLSVRLLGNGVDALITWNDSAVNETEYRLFYRPANGTWNHINLSQNAVSYIYQDQPLGMFEYAIRACNAYGCSGNSTSAFATRYEIPASMTTTATSTANYTSSTTTSTNTTTTVVPTPTTVIMPPPPHPAHIAPKPMPQVAPAPVSITDIEDTEKMRESYEKEMERRNAAAEDIFSSPPILEDRIVSRAATDQEERENLREKGIGIIQEKIEAEVASAVFLDTDKDGVSDYDEANIYGTNPKIADSDKDGVKDGEEILSGTNPLAKKELVYYENPKEILPASATATPAAVPDIFTVENIQAASTTVQSDGTEALAAIRLEGKALPNSFITLYIYSTPLVATVKTDSDGSWTYVLEKELSDGEHEVYIAMTDGNGKILASSKPIPFVKEALALRVGEPLLVAPTAESAEGFFNTSALFTIAIFLIGIVGAALVMLGIRRSGDVSR